MVGICVIQSSLITWFATKFLSLQCLIKFKKELRQMFTCDLWVEFGYVKDIIGNQMTAIILEDKRVLVTMLTNSENQ